MRLQLLLTGNEIMSGDTVDSNSSMVAQRLAPEGFVIDRKVTIGDDFDLLINEIQHLAKHSDALIINGGLGPTIDDLTAQALAAAANIPLEEHAEAKAHVTAWCAGRNFKISASNLKQAILPKGVDILPNAVGSAVGFSMLLDDCLVLCTPGVPSELRVMLDEGVVPALAKKFPHANKPTVMRFQTFGLGESGAQELINKHLPDWPKELELGFRAGAPHMELKVTINDPAHIPLRDEWANKLTGLVGDFIIGQGNVSIASAVTDLLRDKAKKITTAESCTGGLVAAMITGIAGASDVYEAGVVSYSNDIKHSVLSVSKDTLAQHGAVSEQVVREMAAGALALSGADYAVAVSGIAGPSGGTNAKPVGSVWIAWGEQSDMRAKLFFFPVKRDLFQTIVAAMGLDLIRRNILGLNQDPDYYQRKPKT